MRSLAILLTFVAAASAYVVTFPTSGQGWSTAGSQKLTWEMSGGDPSNFTLVLTNPNNGYNQVLYALVDGSMGKLTVSPPGQGWPMGPGFRLQFAANSENVTDVLAQSEGFSIMEPTLTSTTVTSTGTASNTLFTPTFTNSFTPSTTAPTSTSTETSSGNTIFKLPTTGLVVLLALVAALN